MAGQWQAKRDAKFRNVDADDHFIHDKTSHQSKTTLKMHSKVAMISYYYYYYYYYYFYY
jgi:hypothetical protein